MAGPDQACSAERTIFPECKSADRSRLYGICIWQLHNQFIKNHVVLIGCPKLDVVDYTEKLTEIIKHNDFKSLTIVRMEVPCCGGLEHAATEALKASGSYIPWQVVTIGIDGTIKDI